MADVPPELDRSRIRIGLAMITIVMIVALVMIAVIDSGVGKAVMFGVAFLAFVRLFLLARSLRRDS